MITNSVANRSLNSKKGVMKPIHRTPYSPVWDPFILLADVFTICVERLPSSFRSQGSPCYNKQFRSLSMDCDVSEPGLEFTGRNYAVVVVNLVVLARNRWVFGVLYGLVLNGSVVSCRVFNSAGNSFVI